MSHADPVQQCLQGRISPQVALARLLLAGMTPQEIRQTVRAAASTDPAWMALDRAADEPELQRLRALIDQVAVDHAGAATPERIAAMFDRAVAVSPEASVAFYSLGDPEILAEATREVVAWLDARSMLSARVEVLDLGCGIGRMAAALAPRVRSVLGIDVSLAMLREARRRCAGLRNIWFALSAGHDLSLCADAAFDIVLAVDSFPYMVQAGLAERHVAECRRVLRDGGRLVVLNLSYRNDPDLDCKDAAEWAGRCGFGDYEAETGMFKLWDGRAHVFHADTKRNVRS